MRCSIEYAGINRPALLAEGHAESTIHVTGNTVIGALLDTVGRIRQDELLRSSLDRKFGYVDRSKRLVLVTGHRRESFGGRFANICNAFRRIAERDNAQLLYPVHLNPNVQGPVRAILGECEDVFLIEPQDYLSFVYLMDRCRFVITDSGGIQEEAPSLGKPVLVMGETTERPEAIKAGTVRLVGTDVERIVVEATRLLDDCGAYESMVRAHNPYGDGKAA